MPYEYDIFISYRRHAETLRWIKDHFVPLLEVHVDFELGRKPTIFLDEQIESGASLPLDLGKALGASRVLLMLWTGNYLASVWCTEELSQMLVREKEANLRTLEHPYGVVIPAFIHDGERFPADLRYIKPVEIQNTFNVRMSTTGGTAAELAAALNAKAKDIADCIQNAPDWRATWPKEAVDAFVSKFHQQLALQTTVPRFTQP